MEISPFLLAKLLLYSFFLGMLTGVFYDANRVIRIFLGERYKQGGFGRLYSIKLPFLKKEVSLTTASDKGIQKHIRGVVIFFGDMLTVLFGAVGVIILNYSYNDGTFRGFSVVGALVGFLLYYFSIGKLVILVCEPIAFLIKYTFCAFFVILGYPIKLFLYFLIKNVRKICFLCSFILEKRRKKVYNIKEKDFLLKLAKNGFVKK